MPYEVKPLPFTKELTGISKKTMDIHHGTLYTGYVNKSNAIEEGIKKADKAGANATYSEIGELKRQQSFAVNGVYLHEAYFNCLGGDGKPTGALVDWIKRDFGSYENWEADFKAAGMAARGWVILAYDFHKRKLCNYSADVHNQGGIWGCASLVVLDVYEHAYFIDFGANRKGYIDAFMANLNWKAVNETHKVLITQCGAK
ncbi:MAG: hypothetical protein A3G17_05785 [Planctomycetes bacterium RIFCSPLOWO2_12_FULL_50_35]|uniref:superoxide dismutase n=1 Tax=Candidatus Avalokitesvara rifleensis TaxID=3367620 RepID=UPI0008AC60D9|nr:superoxide dismutase [Candidatus Brocadiales bacterium]OHB92756.1 MAG: hypothetical protein A3E75_02310 [Planctomycetes bacterium RIFCSPHIGHO2_12_FULL_51_37]OHB95049.1 MAG: hypothetical protein A3I59_05990 [Planctomycetes bacterium RIFCSPLOWO2_02_FULL_50_16]OHC04305.1 MAG: hypothetical protein A3G17_05785 [Planctomycetes bacterium RIFCSPLOWO2_12_FULL_50_35]HCN20288.1 superoxide dismutase [Planctomycetia bacterium]